MHYFLLFFFHLENFPSNSPFPRIVHSAHLNYFSDKYFNNETKNASLSISIFLLGELYNFFSRHIALLLSLRLWVPPVKVVLLLAFPFCAFPLSFADLPSRSCFFSLRFPLSPPCSFLISELSFPCPLYLQVSPYIFLLA